MSNQEKIQMLERISVLYDRISGLQNQVTLLGKAVEKLTVIVSNKLKG